MNDAPNRGRSSRLPASVGEVIDGKYRVESILGAGGMGVVLGAVHVKLDQPVALKFLLPEAAADELTRARFDREGRAVAQIESEHVARVMDVQSLPDGTPYLVLERLEGRDLADLMDARGAFPVEEAVGFILEACDAIAEAHAIGVVHRDLKPENLFLTERADGTRIIKVIDFGISKVDAGSAAFVPSRNSAVTRTTSVVGSPMYMSPEQLRSARDVDGRSDVWSLAVTLYELLTAQAPFPWGTVPEVCAAVLKETPAPITKHGIELPAGLVEVIERALEKDRDRRWPDVASFALALAPYAGARAELVLDRIVRVSQRAPRRGSTPKDLSAAVEAAPAPERTDVVDAPRSAPQSSAERAVRETVCAPAEAAERSQSIPDAPAAVLSARPRRRGVKRRALAVAAGIAAIASLGALARPQGTIAPASRMGMFAMWIARGAAASISRSAAAAPNDAEALVVPAVAEPTPPIAPASQPTSSPRSTRSSYANAARAFEHRK